jgi:hypothetical protein
VTESPFETVFAPFGSLVPEAFRAQFLLAPEAGHGIRLDGTMDIWRRPAWLAPVFWGMGAAGVLIAQTGRNIPTTVCISAGRDPSGLPYHRFERTFHFARPARFVTTTVYDPRFGRIVDYAAPGQALQVVWCARFEPPATFTLAGDGYALGRGLRSVRVPRVLGRWLFGAGRFTQRVDETHGDTIHLEFTLAHPALGDFFGYRGAFVIHRDPA